MLDLKKDVFLRLVFAARKNETLSKSIKDVRYDSWGNYSSKGLDDSILYDKTVDKTILSRSVKSDKSEHSSKPVKSESLKSRIKSSTKEKIDEKVEKIISDPILAEIKMELEVAEQLLKKIKEVDSQNPKIPILEHTISRMKSMLDQKSYV